MGRGFEPLRGHSTKMLNVWHKTVCLTFSIFLFVFFGEMYVPFLDGSFIYGYFEFGGMVALVGWKRTKSREAGM